MHFDKVQGEYDLNYPCGYKRTVGEVAMSAIMQKHRDYSEAMHPNILTMIVRELRSSS